jgi:hypothetical protein
MAVAISPDVAKEVAEVECKGRVLGDGVGTISMDLLRRMWTASPENGQTKPRAFRIRFAGQ